MKKQIHTTPGEVFLECEKLWIFLMMIIAGGFLGAYTYILKGGVFCNAQTANFVMLAINIGETNWSRAGYFLIPISAYLSGTMLSEFLPKHVNEFELLRWETFFVAFEMLCIFALGFVPDSAPPQICQVAINFIASMQFNTFRQAEKVPMATTFCTNHLRQIGVYLVKSLRHRDNRESHERLIMHFLMILAFVAGGILSTLLCGIFKGKAIWFAEIPLAIVFIDLLIADLGSEKNKIHVIPHGH